MSGSAPVPSLKTCSVCGVDLSGQKRVKDGTGAYCCATCYEAVIPSASDSTSDAGNSRKPLIFGIAGVLVAVATIATAATIIVRSAAARREAVQRVTAFQAEAQRLVGIGNRNAAVEKLDAAIAVAESSGHVDPAHLQAVQTARQALAKEIAGMEEAARLHETQQEAAERQRQQAEATKRQQEQDEADRARRAEEERVRLQQLALKQEQEAVKAADEQRRQAEEAKRKQQDALLRSADAVVTRLLDGSDEKWAGLTPEFVAQRTKMFRADYHVVPPNVESFVIRDHDMMPDGEMWVRVFVKYSSNKGVPRQKEFSFMLVQSEGKWLIKSSNFLEKIVY